MTPIFRADSIGKRFGDRTVLTAASLRAFTGQVTYLIGRNGCGKSTLLRIVTGLESADSGTVTFAGKTHLRPRWHRLARGGLFYLPDRDLMAPDRTVGEHLASIVRQFGSGSQDAAVAALRIEPLLNRRPDTLSTGERRRAEVALAVARNPACLLADEPHRNIDPTDRQIIAGALLALARQGCAVVITGHEVEDIATSVDTVTWCTDGTTYELGDPATALGHWRLVRDYVGPGRAERLLVELSRTAGRA